MVRCPVLGSQACSGVLWVAADAGMGSIALNDRRKDTGKFQQSRCSELKGQWLETGERLGNLPEGQC